MISYRWCEQLVDDDRAEVLELVRMAADYDHEAGFTAIPAADVEAVSRAGVVVRHLPIKARRDLSARDDAPMLVVAYLHLSIDDNGQGSVAYVVHPDYRSRGVTTMLVEELGIDVTQPGGWVGTGATALRAWAYGSHPASERLTGRFGIEAVRRLWTLSRNLTGPFAVDLAPASVPAGYAVNEASDMVAVTEIVGVAGLPTRQAAEVSDGIASGTGSVLIASDQGGQPVGFVWFDPELHKHLELRAAWVRALVLTPQSRGSGLGTALLTRALEELEAVGAQTSLIRIDPEDEGAVRMLRLLSYEQEDAHACFQVGAWKEGVES